MEDASKALLIAAAVLIGVMLLALGVYLFQVFGNSSKQINKQLTDAQISEFNSQFYKYEGIETCKAHDIVSISNLAQQNNEKYYKYEYGTDYASKAQNDPYYISVKVENIDNDYLPNHFENNPEAQKQAFLKQYSLKSDNTPYYFECKGVDISQVTKMVNSITFILKD